MTTSKVYLIAHQISGPDYHLFVKEVAAGYDPDANFADSLCEQSGRVCYGSFDARRPGGNEAYLKHIKECGHGEVLEHAVFTFHIEGISRSCCTQLTRYRAGWSFCVRSSRYCDEEHRKVVQPPGVELPQELKGEACNLEDWVRQFYGRVVKYLQEKGLTRKRARQAARYWLLEGRSIAVTFTANARAIRHAIEQRCSPDADVEIRGLFNQVYEKLIKTAPNLFGDYARQDLEDGTYVLTTLARKV